MTRDIRLTFQINNRIGVLPELPESDREIKFGFNPEMLQALESWFITADTIKEIHKANHEFLKICVEFGIDTRPYLNKWYNAKIPLDAPLEP